MNERVRVGVGLVLVARETGRILTLKELRDKPEIEKKAGMISFPLETMESGETKEKTVRRLIEEEIGVTDLDVKPIFFGGVFSIVKNAKTLAAYAFCESEFVPISNDDDVEFFGWLLPHELTYSGRLTRKEVRPIITCLLATEFSY